MAKRKNTMTRENAEMYGMTYGNAYATRLATLPSGTRIIEVGVLGGGLVHVYLSKAGRSIRVIKDGRELR